MSLMHSKTCSILSIVPYKFLPPTSGGHLGIALPHHYIGLLCPDHIATTRDNEQEHNYSFQVHRVFPADPKRYIPFYQYSRLLGLAKAYDVTCIYLDHPYMALTAMALSKKLGIPWYLRVHNIESERFRGFGKKWWRVLRSYERFAMRQASGLFCVAGEDGQWAVDNFGVNPAKVHTIPYGTTLSSIPESTTEIRNKVAADLQIDPSKPWLYFLGALDYYPNSQALGFILDEVMPRLNAKGIDYQILVAGKGIPDSLKEQIEQTEKIKYTGFIPDLDHFLRSCDVMLNPVLLGGGIKTKVVEALGYNKTVISPLAGATGILPEVCGNKLLLSADYDWDTFVHNTIRAIGNTDNIPSSFYQTYYWGNVARKAVDIMLRS